MKKFDLIGKDGRNAVKGGGYSLIITAVVLAILIVINLFASALPSALTKQDISSSQLYSVTSNTKVQKRDHQNHQRYRQLWRGHPRGNDRGDPEQTGGAGTGIGTGQGKSG